MTALAIMINHPGGEIMDAYHFTVPYITTLRKKEGWTRDPNDEYRYSIIRCHYLLLGDEQLDGQPKKGEVIDAIATIKGVTEEKVYSSEREVTITHVKESIEEKLKEEES
jgi:hypothetical protein